MSFVESLHLSRQSVQDIAVDQMFFPAFEGQPAKISVKDGHALLCIIKKSGLQRMHYHFSKMMATFAAAETCVSTSDSNASIISGMTSMAAFWVAEMEMTQLSARSAHRHDWHAKSSDISASKPLPVKNRAWKPLKEQTQCRACKNLARSLSSS